MKVLMILMFANYFVTPTGSPDNDGSNDTTEAWELQHALSTAAAGDVVWVKAGIYEGYYVQTNNGTEGNLITFIGYTNSPYDILFPYKNGEPRDGSVYPLISEDREVENVGTGFGLRINGNYVRVKNFHAQYYSQSIRLQGANSIFGNLAAFDSGNFTSSSIYNGVGIQITAGCENSLFEDLYSENSAAEGISVYGSNNIFERPTVWADDTLINPPDYYFTLLGNASHNKINGAYIRRNANLFHGGHGLSVKSKEGNAQYNVFTNFEIYNTFLEIQFSNAAYNQFINGKVINEWDNGNYGGVNIRNGAHHNLLQKVEIVNGDIKFNTNTEEAVNGADDNVFDRVIVRDSPYGIRFFFYDQTVPGGSSDNNTFYNCTFSNIGTLFEDSRANTNTRFVNCVFDDVENYSFTHGSASSFGVNAEYFNSNFYGLGFAVPEGTDISTFNTDFDERLRVGEDLQGTAIKTPYLKVGKDLGTVQKELTPVLARPNLTIRGNNKNYKVYTQ